MISDFGLSKVLPVMERTVAVSSDQFFYSLLPSSFLDVESC